MLSLFSRNFSTKSKRYLEGFCNDLALRGLIENAYPGTLLTNDAIKKIPDVAYAGFDPTAESLHVGNLVILSSLLRGSANGLKTFALVGGATALIGDPSGKIVDRAELAKDIVTENANKIESDILKLIQNTQEYLGKEIDCTVVNNIEWYRDMSMIDFLRLSRSFRVGPMLRMGHIKHRMKDDGEGLTFTEFSYQILQSHDWYLLAQKHSCFFQLGGSDQLGHVDIGAHYIKSKLNKQAAGICLPLITDGSGAKLGKSTSNKDDSIWLNSSLTSPFAFYQYFRQLHDDTAEKLMPYFSMKPIEEINNLLKQHKENLGKWIAQTALAEELTSIVHGSNGLKIAQRCSNVLFNGSVEDFRELDIKTILNLFGKASTFSISRSNCSTFGALADCVRKDRIKGSDLMTKGAFKVNGIRRDKPDERIDFDSIILAHNVTLICWGKRKFSLVKWL
uniref:Tyrosine--tRNA ligase n=1 Tax=Panagrolaimus sp. ES5 TaxID=591445 RepID=A0AC34F0N6_9BILA